MWDSVVAGEGPSYKGDPWMASLMDGTYWKNHPKKKRRKKPTKEAIGRRRVTDSLRYKVMRRDDFFCQLCGATGKDARLVVDHIIPVAKGGDSAMENLRTLCDPCNIGKGVKGE